jgi:hypothetical protein
LRNARTRFDATVARRLLMNETMTKKPRAKNPYGKAIPYAKAKTDAYAVYVDAARGCTWYVLKTYQSPEKAQGNKFARAFCLVTSPFVGELGELGDFYLSEIYGELIRGADIRGDGQHAVRSALGGITYE